MNQRSWMANRPRDQFPYRRPGEMTGWEGDVERIVSLRPPLPVLLRRAQGPRDVVRAMEQVLRAGRVRRAGGRAIIKDPFALLLSEWLHDLTGAHVIICVRHPAAFTSSVKRLGWRLDETWLLSQPDLLADELESWSPSLERAGGLDLISHACLVWNVLNTVVRELAVRYPTWTVTRYEDLALDPVTGFERVFGTCELPWNDDLASRIRAMNSPANPAEVESDRIGGVRRDSRNAIWTWQDRLTDDEVAQVQSLTAEVAEAWYADPRWWERA